jgi:hypothetical protein
MCPNLSSNMHYFGLTKDNVDGGGDPGKFGGTPNVDESGYPWRTNPCTAGTYTFRGFAASIRDADADNIDNSLDTCPYKYDPLCDPTNDTYPRDSDQDALCDVCDPTAAGYDPNPDNDLFDNFQDNCPLVANDSQLDTDLDRIGDPCDDYANDATDGGKSMRVEQWFEGSFDVTGEGCPTPTPSPTATATETATATGTAAAGGGAATATATVGAGTPVPTVKTSLAQDAKAGATEITLTDVTGFAVGDTIEIGTGATKETNTITAISGKTLTLATALKSDHASGEQVAKVVAAGIATPTPTAEGEICGVVFPGTYNGRVLIDGKPAESGYQLTASIGGTQWGSAIVTGGRYAMEIPDKIPAKKPCFDGGTITFALNGMTCTPVEKDADVWKNGVRNVDLNCAPVAPPVTPAPTTTTPPGTTPTPKATTPPAAVTPTPAPTKMPPTGAGGLSGSSSGLPLWAMALAGWAGLMTVAGLGTLMAAKRR